MNTHLTTTLPLSICVMCPFPWWVPPWWLPPWWLPWWLPCTLPWWLPGPPLVIIDVVPEAIPPELLLGGFLQTDWRQQQTRAAVQKIQTISPPTIIPTDAATPRERNLLNMVSSEIKYIQNLSISNQPFLSFWQMCCQKWLWLNWVAQCEKLHLNLKCIINNHCYNLTSFPSSHIHLSI